MNAALAQRTLAAIERNGGTVTFLGADVPAGPPVYDPETDEFTGGGSGSSEENVTGRAVQITGDPDRFAALGLVLENPVTLAVAAHGLGITPTVGESFVWPEDGTTYVIKDPQDIGLDGDPILWIVTGDS